jgi:hypothetical protein
LIHQWYAGGSNCGIGLKYETGSNSEVIIHSYESSNHRAYYTIYYNVITPVIENGTYFLKNKETDRFVDIENQELEEGKYIHQWDLNGDNSQRWKFTYTHKGNYYVVKSVHIAIIPGRQGRNSRPVRVIMGGQKAA